MPLKKLSRKEKEFMNQPWFTLEIIEAIKKKDRLLNKMKKGKDPVTTAEYNKQRNFLKRLKTKTYNEHY